MKSLGIFIHTLGGGGAEKVLVDLINGIDKNEFKVTLYPIINTGQLLNSVNSDIEVIPLIKVPSFLLNRHTNDKGTLVKGEDGKISTVSKMYMKLWATSGKLISKTLKRKIKKHDLIVSYLEGPTNSFISNINFEVPKVAWVHVDMRVEKKSEGFFKSHEHIRKHFESFDHIAAVSNDVRESVYQYIDRSKEVDVIYNIYNNKNIVEQASKTLPNHLSDKFKNDKINVVSVGRLSNQKGYDRLIEAMNTLKSEDYDAFQKLNIMIVGDGEDRNKLQDLIEKYSLVDSVELLGFHDNPYQLISNSDCFISSSRTEGYSTVVVESVIIGTPVFTTDCSGMKEILDGGDLGFIKENSTDGVLELLKDISKTNFDSETIKAMSEKGKGKYDTQRQVRLVENYFNKIIDSH